ncbi:MAG: SipW-dependent-type signal peptide-containing protein [Clostridia bacterium]|nr:SipW-dependent-type signal peptide-containing protein [Clostridia bacterium]
MLGNKRNLKKAIVAVAAVCVMLVGGASAYFTATDDKTNTWTVGNVDIELHEPGYDASDRDNITPNQELDKDPVVENTGNNEAYIFVKFSIPKASVKTVGPDGTPTAASVQELFDYTVDESWTLVDQASGTDSNTYIYAYAVNGQCVAVDPEDTTEVVFTDGKIKFKNVIEGQIDSTLTLPVYAYAIQTGDITEDGSIAPADVWEVLSGQVSSVQ